MPFEPGRSGNPAGGPVGSRHRQQLNGEFIAALLRDFRHGGPKAIERVLRTQPAAYLKILTLLCPREHKVEHRNPVKDMTDEELEAAIEFIQKMLATQAEKAKVIDGTTDRKFGQNRFLAGRRSWRGNGVACFWATSLEKIFGGVIAIVSFRPGGRSSLPCRGVLSFRSEAREGIGQ